MKVRRVLLASGELVDPEDLPEATIRRPPPLPTAREIVVPVRVPVVTDAPDTDLELLDAVLSKPADLNNEEREAFGTMRRLLLGGRVDYLSFKRRAWAQKVAASLGFTSHTASCST